MSQSIREKLKQKQLEYIIQSKEYEELLNDLSADIGAASLTAINEASVVSIFELELFGFIKEILGLKYYPEKEKAINTEIHISKGRIDSKIGALVIEYKHHSKLKSKESRDKASLQLISYLKGLEKFTNQNYYGVLTDGIQCKGINLQDGIISEGSFEKLSKHHLSDIVKSIVLLDKVALTPENLIKDFCEPKEKSLVQRLVICLYDTIKNSPSNRTLMLFEEWKELFRLAHDDKSKQTAIEERRKSIENILNSRLKSNEEEYLALYSLQTTYAIIVKTIAYKVISKIRFNKSLIDFNKLSTSDFDTLRFQMNSLEEGAIFRSLGIGNLLEGDFFAWYSYDNQWNEKIGYLVQEIFTILTQYEDKAIFESGENIRDLFRDLFMKVIPDKVRHSLGEFYTPSWLADNLINNAISLHKTLPNNWSALDPCAGSGTFLTVLIKKVLVESKGQTSSEKLKSILNRVKGIDLNPLAVLTSRINYFVNISPLISENDIFEIPVYLGDASYVPTKITIGEIPCFKYSVKTIKSHINIEVPISAVKDAAVFSQTMTSIEQDIHNLDSDSIVDKLASIIPENELTELIKEKLQALANQFVELERNDWNGIWARIVTNFLTTANLGKFDLIVGNLPWIDWKNLPEGYRERIKSICIDRHLFSGDGLTGGINLNICALISNVAAQNWLGDDGIMAFLMPQSILFQSSYEGYRNLYQDEDNKLYFQQVSDWTKAGHPFKPVQHKFLSYFIGKNKTDYKKGIPVIHFSLKKKLRLDDYFKAADFASIDKAFDIKKSIIGQSDKRYTSFTYANNQTQLNAFKKIVGESFYTGRDGIDFYPQELYMLKIQEDFKIDKEKIFVKNFQNKKAKHKIIESIFPMETKFLYPLIRSVDISRFHIKGHEFIVPFPYISQNPRTPLTLKEISRESPLLG